MHRSLENTNQIFMRMLSWRNTLRTILGKADRHALQFRRREYHFFVGPGSGNGSVLCVGNSSRTPKILLLCDFLQTNASTRIFFCSIPESHPNACPQHPPVRFMTSSSFRRAAQMQVRTIFCGTKDLKFDILIVY